MGSDLESDKFKIFPQVLGAKFIHLGKKNLPICLELWAGFRKIFNTELTHTQITEAQMTKFGLKKVD